jgi:hypothetical protein
LNVGLGRGVERLGCIPYQWVLAGLFLFLGDMKIILISQEARRGSP